MAGNNGKAPAGTQEMTISGLTVQRGSKMNPSERGVTAIIYSEPGMGKTHSVRFLPEDDRTVYIGLEAGGEAPLEGFDIPLFNLELEQSGTGLANFKMLIDSIRLRKKVMGVDFSKVQFLVVDHLTEMERFFQFSLMHYRKKKFLELKEYGDTGQKMREYVRYLRDLRNHGINVVMLAHEMYMETTDANGVPVTLTYPKLGKTYVSEVIGMVDVVGRLELQHTPNGEVERIIRLQKSPTVMAKCRWTEFYGKFGDTFSQDIGQLFRELYKIRKERQTNKGGK